MGFWGWISIVGTSFAVSVVVAVVVARYLVRISASVPTLMEGSLERVHYPCYRCGEVEGDVEYMGLHYCSMCQMVVVQAMGLVRHDPPFGFPGSPGYTEFPMKGPPAEEKKEA